MRHLLDILLLVCAVFFSQGYAARDQSSQYNELHVPGGQLVEQVTEVPDVPLDDGESDEEELENSRIGAAISEWVPHWARPYTGGSFSVGDGMVGVHWDFNSLLNEQDGWWNGPHVCTSRTVVNTTDVSSGAGGDILMTHHTYRSVQCDQTNTAYRCVTTLASSGFEQKMTEIHECCHGYRRVEGESGCPEALHLVDMKKTLETLGASQFVKALESLQLVDVLTQNNFTIFAPDDEAFQVYFPIKPEDMEVVVISPNMVHMANNIRETLLTHMSRGVHTSGRIQDEQLFNTVEADIHIRTNMYDVPRQLLTANCIPVISPDNLSSNGVVHIISRVLAPVTETIAEIISKKPQLTLFASLIRDHGMMQTLREPGQFTLFIPTNDAFLSIPDALRQRILDGDGCVSNLVSHHLLSHTVCSSVIEGRIQTTNILREVVRFHKDGGTGKLYVNGAEIQTIDIMAENGVIHFISSVIIPDQAIGVTEMTSRLGATDWAAFVNNSDVRNQVDGTTNFTLFVPTNQAMQSLTASERSTQSSNIIKYHMVPQQVSGAQLHNGQNLPTLNSNSVVRVHRYHSTPFGMHESRTAQCAGIVHTDVKTCGGTIHVINKVLRPPSGNLLTTLTNDGRFNTLLRLVRQADIENLLRANDPITLLAPTDNAFSQLSDTQMRMLTEESSYKLGNFLKHHMLRGDLCCSGVFEGPFFWKQKERAMDGSYVKVGRTTGQGHRVHVDHNTPIVECDHTATNGIIHVIEHVMPSATHKYFRHRWSGHSHRRGRVAQTVDSMVDGIHGIVNSRRVQDGVNSARDTVQNGMNTARDTVQNGVNSARDRMEDGVQLAHAHVQVGVQHARDTWDDFNDHINSQFSGFFGNHRNKKK